MADFVRMNMSVGAIESSTQLMIELENNWTSLVFFDFFFWELETSKNDGGKKTFEVCKVPKVSFEQIEFDHCFCPNR